MDSIPDSCTRRGTSHLLVEVIQDNRRKQQERDGLADVLHHSLELNHDQSRTIDQLRAQNADLRAQLRAALSGRTVAEERYALEASTEGQAA